MKKVLSVILSFVMLVSVTTGITMTAQATTGSEIVSYARQFIGYPYVYGTQGPNSFDCSGFVQYVFKHFGISLPASSSSYWNSPTSYGTVVGSGSTANAQAGDVISWSGHVAIYTENGKCVEALNSKYGVTESVPVNSHTNGTNYKVIRIYGIYSGAIYNEIPNAPSSIATSNGRNQFGTDEYITFNWASVSNATSYWIYMWKDGTQIYDTDMGNNLSFTSAPTSAGNYTLIVRAGNSAGYSTNGASLSFVVNNTSSAVQPLNIGDNFYAYIIKMDSWHHLQSVNYDVKLANGNDSYDPSQIWHFIRYDNWYKIYNEYDGRYLDVKDVSSANGANVQTWPGNDSAAQRWYILKCGAGYKLQPIYTDKVLDVYSDSNENGANIQIYTSNDSNAQIFSIYNITTDGWSYSYPVAPSKPKVSVEKNERGAKISWTASAENGKLDSRTYELNIYKKNNGTYSLFYSTSGLKKTSITVDLDDNCTYSLDVNAVNSKYLNYYTASNPVEFSYKRADYCNHNYIGKTTKSSTCLTTGVETFTCSKCSDSFIKSIPKAEHTYDNGTITKSPTYTETGTKIFTCTVCGITKTETIAKLAKKANTLKASGKTKSVKKSTLKKKNVSITRKNAITVSNAQGKVTYKKAGGNKKITISSAGKITVKKGLKKGTYKVSIKVTAAGNASYKAKTVTVTVTIKVK